MKLCNDKHEEVCYDGRYCPVCSVRDDLESDISKLKDKQSELENQIGELESQIEEMTSNSA